MMMGTQQSLPPRRRSARPTRRSKRSGDSDQAGVPSLCPRVIGTTQILTDVAQLTGMRKAG